MRAFYIQVVVKTIMVSTRMKKQQITRSLSQLDEFSRNLAIGNSIQANDAEKMAI